MQAKGHAWLFGDCTADNLNVVAKPRREGQVPQGFVHKTGAIQISFPEREKTGSRDALAHRGPSICAHRQRGGHARAAVTVRCKLTRVAAADQHRVNRFAADAVVLVEHLRNLLDGGPMNPDNPISTVERVVDAAAYRLNSKPYPTGQFGPRATAWTAAPRMPLPAR